MKAGDRVDIYNAGEVVESGVILSTGNDVIVKVLPDGEGYDAGYWEEWQNIKPEGWEYEPSYWGEE
jgi:hypothetical protein